jgi:hypothetical protein
MDFVKATDALIDRTTLGEIAEACGVSENSVQRARMAGEGRRSPPPGWEAALAKLARKRGGELVKLAEQLERA